VARRSRGLERQSEEKGRRGPGREKGGRSQSEENLSEKKKASVEWGGGRKKLGMGTRGGSSEKAREKRRAGSGGKRLTGKYLEKKLQSTPRKKGRSFLP